MAIASAERHPGQPAAFPLPGAEPSQALRLLAPNGILVGSRPLVLACSLAARAGLLRGHALWKDAQRPIVALDLTDRTGARWIRRTFEPDSRGRFVDPRTWQAMRARGFLLGGSTPIPLQAARRALCRPLHGARVAVLSPGGAVAKVTCFVTEDGHDQPSVVVRAMADPSRGDWLEREVDMVAALLRSLRLSPDVAEALPSPPLLLGRIRNETVVVERCNAVSDGDVPRAEARALDWLVAFQRATETARRPWSDKDSCDVLGSVERALAGPAADRAPDLLPALNAALGRLRGLDVPRCAVHGDFWRGNLAFEGDRLRVFDWEWARQDGLPLLDHAAWEFGALRPTERQVEPAAVHAAVHRIADRLPRAGIPSAFAPVALVHAAAELSTRVEHEFGREGAIGDAATPVLAAVGTLLRNDDLHHQAVTA